MEKVIYVLSAAPGRRPDQLLDQLLGPTAAQLHAAGGHGLEVSVADAAVEPADGLRIVPGGAAPAAIVSVWLHSANDVLRRGVDDVLAEVVDDVAAYLVTESVPLRDARTARGERAEGFVQVAFLRRPDALDVDEWLRRWLDDHTPVALATQDTFVYVQNRVTRVLGDGAPAWDAIVEEGFPAAAMTDPQAFFAAADADELADHQQRMFASVQRFIDLASIQVIPMSRHLVDPAP